MIEAVPDIDTSELSAEVIHPATGRVRLLSAHTWRTIDPVLLRLWCWREARYGIPTTELVEWLKALIGTRKAIEVGAGMGDLGFHLGIPMSDNASQILEPEAVAYYRAIGCTPTQPPPDVERVDAETAVQRAGPGAVVIASWMTQRWKPGEARGCMFGPDEERLLRIVLDGGGSYVHIGNMAVHGDKRIRGTAHCVHWLPFLVSRAKRPDLNVVYMWERTTA